MARVWIHSHTQSRSLVSELELKKLYQKILISQRAPIQDVEVAFVKSPIMKQLNRQFRQKNKTTDVLSFHSSIPDLLGSIVIDLAVAKKQAREYQHSIKQEILELFIHGVLHLLGFDHEKASDAKKMKAQEIRLSKFLKLQENL
ncbi:MAG: rRNA maturation RNase YbeY [Deltaproteobacteria bacterium]|nr:rRNA maturation RNase YbeY [Deltaproteobacteria bacterium]